MNVIVVFLFLTLAFLCIFSGECFEWTPKRSSHFLQPNFQSKYLSQKSKSRVSYPFATFEKTFKEEDNSFSHNKIVELARISFETASVSPITEESFQQWTKQVELASNAISESNKIDSVRSCYESLLRSIPTNQLDLLHLATFDRVISPFVLQSYKLYQGSLRNFVDLLNEAHFMFIDNVLSSVSSSAESSSDVVCQYLCMIFERVFDALNDCLLGFDQSTTARQQRLFGWLAPLEARMQRCVPTFVMGSFRNLCSQLRTTALENMLNRLEFRVRTNRSSQYAAKALATHVGDVLRHIEDPQANAVARSDMRSSVLISLRRILSQRLTPLLLPATRLRGSLFSASVREQSGMPSYSSSSIVISSVMDESGIDELGLVPNGICAQLLPTECTIAEKWMKVAQECVSAAMLSWQCQQSQSNWLSGDTEESGIEVVENEKERNDRLDNLEQHLEKQHRTKVLDLALSQESEGDFTQTQSLESKRKYKIVDPSHRIKRLPLLTDTYSLFRAHPLLHSNSQDILLRTLLSIPGDTREDLCFMMKRRFQDLELFPNFTTISSNGTRSDGKNYDLFVTLQEELTHSDKFSSEASSVYEDLVKLKVLTLYQGFKSFDPQEEQQQHILPFSYRLGAALLLSESVRSECVGRFRALNLYQNFREDLVALSRDAQFEGVMSVMLLDYIGAPVCVTEPDILELQLQEVLLRRLVSCAALDAVLAVPDSFSASATALSEAALCSLHALASSYDRIGGYNLFDVQAAAKIIRERLISAKTAVIHIFSSQSDNIQSILQLWQEELLNSFVKQRLQNIKHDNGFAMEVERLRSLCCHVICVALNLPSNTGEALVVKHITEEFDKQTTNVLLEHFPIDDQYDGNGSSLSQQLGATLEEKLFCMAPVLSANVSTESEVLIRSDARRRIVLLASQILAQILILAAREHRAGNWQRLQLLSERFLSALKHPLLFHIFSCDSELTLDWMLRVTTKSLAIGSNEVLEQYLRHPANIQAKVGRERMTALAEVVRTVDSMRQAVVRRNQNQNSYSDDWRQVGSAYSERDLSLFSQLKSLLMNEYANSIVQ